MASVPFALAINLELARYGLLAPIFVAYAICTVIKNAGTGSTIVQQVDYVVWRIIFLALNLILVNFAIWHKLILTTEGSSTITESNTETEGALANGQIPPNNIATLKYSSRLS